MPFSGNVKVLRLPTIKHFKEVKRTGLNVASGNFPAGSNVRIRHSK
jgi:hypothetical protein